MRKFLRILLPVFMALVIFAVGYYLGMQKTTTEKTNLSNNWFSNSNVDDIEKTLWNKDVSVLTINIPRLALQDGEQAYALSSDGKRILVCGKTMPCLVDIETFDRTPLYLADKETKNAIKKYLRNYTGNAKLNYAFTDENLLNILYDTVMSEKYRFTLEPQKYPNLLNGYLPITLREADLQFLLDMKTGALYSRYMCECIMIKNGQLLAKGAPPSAYVTISNLNEQTEEYIDIIEKSGLNDYNGLQSAAILDDNSIVAIIREKNINLKDGQETKLVILSPSGGVRTIPLGKRIFGNNLDQIVCIDNRFIILSGSIEKTHAYIVDIKNNTISCLHMKNEQISFTSLQECLENNGEDKTGNDSITLIGESSDKKHIMIAIGKKMYLVDPERQESQQLPSEINIDAYDSISGNGYDLFMTQYGNTYIQLLVQ